MSIQTHYNQWAATYDSDRNLTRDLDRSALQELVGTQRYASILELGCGTGKNSGWLIERTGRLLALDFAPAMIRQAQQRVRLSGATFALADLTQPWPCASTSIALATCNLVLEHIEDLRPIFREAARVLRPGGTLLVCELHPYRQVQGSQARFTQGAETVHIPAFVHLTEDYAAAAQAAGLQQREVREWWHSDDAHGKPPRLLSLRYQQPLAAC